MHVLAVIIKLSWDEAWRLFKVVGDEEETTTPRDLVLGI